MRILFIILFMILQYSIYCQSNITIKASEYKQIALDKIKKKDYVSAINYLDSAININNVFATAYYDRGIVKRIIGNFKESLVDLNIAINLCPNDSEFVYVRGLTEMKLEQYDAARTDFDFVISKNKMISEPFNQRGLAFDYLNKWKEAIYDFNNAILIDSLRVDYYINRAIVNTKLENYISAEADCSKALILDVHKYYESDIYYYRGIARKFIHGKNEMATDDLIHAALLNSIYREKLFKAVNNK